MKRSYLAPLWLGAIIAWACFTPHCEMDLPNLLHSPTWPSRAGGLFGTDAFGRDLFCALGEAIGRSLSFATIATTFAMGAGVLFGAALGILAGRTRFILERILDFFLAFPPMLLALALQAHIGTGWRSLGFSVIFGLFPGVVRYVASRAKEIEHTEFVYSARALGGSTSGIFWRHYRPELVEHLRIKFPSLFAQALLLEATLSFLNLGVPPGVVSWGSLLGQAKDYLIEAPHIAWIVGPPLVLTLFALQTWVDDATQTNRNQEAL